MEHEFSIQQLNLFATACSCVQFLIDAREFFYGGRCKGVCSLEISEKRILLSAFRCAVYDVSDFFFVSGSCLELSVAQSLCS